LYAIGAISKFGEISEKSKHSAAGTPESRLEPYSKQEIKDCFNILFRFFSSKTSLRKFQKKYPEKAKYIISKDFYQTLQNGYPFLSHIIPDSVFNITNKSRSIFIESISNNKTYQIDEIKDILELIQNIELEKLNLSNEIAGKNIDLDIYPR